jgi:hypothetical protein
MYVCHSGARLTCDYLGGRTTVTWSVREVVVGEHVSVFLDGELLVVTSARAEGSLHLMGAPRGYLCVFVCM